jgi:3-dehydrosphinganine reductase
MKFFAGKKVFVSGGSSGIGLSAALQLAASGAHVAIVARGREKLDQAVSALKAKAARPDQILLAKALDVTDRVAVRRVADETLKELGGIDVVIANSGYALTGWVHEMPDAIFDEEIQVNYLGHVNVVRAFLPTLIAQKHGNICLVSSMLGFMGSFGYTAYCASKYAVAGLAEAMRHELKPHGIKITLLYPPTTKTPASTMRTRPSPSPCGSTSPTPASTRFTRRRE